MLDGYNSIENTPVSKEYTIEEFNRKKNEVIKDMIDFVSGDEYRNRLIIEYKINKLGYDDFQLDTFRSKINEVTLNEDELKEINSELQKRKDIITSINDKVHLYTLAFEEDKQTIIEGEGFYISSNKSEKSYYRFEGDNSVKECEKSHIYIKNQTESENDIDFKATLFHELSHAIVDGFEMITPGANRLLSKHTNNYYKGSEKYTGNKAEQFARLGEARFYLKSYGITTNINENITSEHLSKLLALPITDRNTQSMLIHLKEVIKLAYRNNDNYSDYLNLINSIAEGKRDKYSKSQDV